MLRHLRFGYLAQLSGLITMTVGSIVLPNSLGVAEFAVLNKTMALIGLGCVVFNEGVGYLIVRCFKDCPKEHLNPGRLVAQGAFEHLILGYVGIGLVLIYLYSNGEASVPQYFESLIIFISVFGIALYIPAVAVLVAIGRNDLVILLGLLQGAASVIFPLILWSAKIDVRYSIPMSYGVGIAAYLLVARQLGIDIWRQAISLKNPAIIRKDIFALIVPAFARICIIWLPIILFIQAGDDLSAAVYRIALSILIGAVALVPFNKGTMLSVADSVGASLANQVANLAIFVAGFGTVCLVSIATTLTFYLYKPEYSPLSHVLRELAPFILIQIIVDIGLVGLIIEHRDRALLQCFLGSVMLGVLSTAMIDLNYFPIVTGLISIIFLGFSGKAIELLAAPGTAATLVAVLSGLACAYSVSGWLGGVLGVASMLVVVICNSSARQSMFEVFSRLSRS